ncbi:MAG: ribonuclease HII [Parcubacteria group bacterium CG08_land_8_20_14_0_20_43_9]|nr:MAG: ribonuclease HII [Parcubacteria group bacterium CG08_land_8_20_14_0_20_43_9]
MKSSLELERKLASRGFGFVIGIDEAGRGALAGPVIAVAIMINDNLSIINNRPLGAVDDSKKLSPKKREKIYETLKAVPAIQWGRGLVSAKVIDRINILQATKLAARRAIANLEKKLGKRFPADKTIVIMDGNQGIDSKFKEMPIVRADGKVFLCASASIVAKVERDRLMRRYHKIYTRYNFARHKGYPTALHRRTLKRYGACKLHRRTFYPVSGL